MKRRVLRDLERAHFIVVERPPAKSRLTFEARNQRSLSGNHALSSASVGVAGRQPAWPYEPADPSPCRPKSAKLTRRYPASVSVLLRGTGAALTGQVSIKRVTIRRL